MPVTAAAAASARPGQPPVSSVPGAVFGPFTVRATDSGSNSVPRLRRRPVTSRRDGLPVGDAAAAQRPGRLGLGGVPASDVPVMPGHWQVMSKKLDLS